MRLAVVPARGGSKRIPHKNIRDFCGKPIIAWSIEAALSSGCFDRVIVSTDDASIASTARDWGAEVPFMRPESLSDDHTGTTEVVAHSIEVLRSRDFNPETVCCIYATAPFIEPQDLERGLASLSVSGAEFAFSVTSYEFPIQRALRLKPDGRLEMLHPENFQVRSQDLEETCHDAGQFYWGRAEAWCSGKPLFSPDAVPVFLPRHRVQDIDTAEDWERAEWLFRAQNQLTPE